MLLCDWRRTVLAKIRLLITESVEHDHFMMSIHYNWRGISQKSFVKLFTSITLSTRVHEHNSFD